MRPDRPASDGTIDECLQPAARHRPDLEQLVRARGTLAFCGGAGGQARPHLARLGSPPWLHMRGVWLAAGMGSH